jgi:deoxyribose-phosphate aldolase
MLPDIDQALLTAQEELATHHLLISPTYASPVSYNVPNPFHVTDLTFLKPHGGEVHIKALCSLAIAKKAKTVCVQPIHIALAQHLLLNSSVQVITVEGFPFGTASLTGLTQSIESAFRAGVSEVDIVFPHHFMTSHDYVGALNYLSTIRSRTNGILKIILETCAYSKRDIAIMSLLAKAARFDFVKTSTGFSSGGATLFDVALMRRCVGPNIGVKASGGIKTVDEAHQFLHFGASRIGASGLSDEIPETERTIHSY